MQRQLKEGEETLSPRSKRLLRNKKSALENRVNQKLESESLKRDMQVLLTKFEIIAEECLKVIPCKRQQGLMNRITEIHQKSEQAD